MPIEVLSMGREKGAKKRTLMMVYAHCEQTGNFRFNNALVKRLTGEELSNQFDTTKIDTSAMLPAELKERDLFIVHLGKGWHQFVRGIAHGYHALEPVSADDVHDWDYVPGILDKTDDSEAGVLSLAFNQQILQHFLYGNRIVQLFINVPRRTRGKDTNSFDYLIGDQTVTVSQLQIEMDFIVEKNGEIALAEAKCAAGALPRDFAVVQVYLPYKRLLKMLGHKLEAKKIRSMFFVQYTRPDGKDCIRVYEYTFADPQSMSSLRFVRNAEYVLNKEQKR
jgi:hypothetical protein